MYPSHVFQRRLDRKLPLAVRAEGVWITDESGKRYLDASGGPICVNIGHGRKRVAMAMAEQAESLAYVHGTMFTSEPVERLAERLSFHAGRDLDRFYFLSSGSEAVEAAVKLARQIQTAKGNSQRYRILSRWNSYHGATLGALSVTGKPSMRAPFLPMLSGAVRHIPPPYCYRCTYGLSPSTCGMRCAWALEEALLLEGKDSIAAFIAETIGGATIGAIVPPPDYYPVIASICRKYGILLILDEVMSGMGRTGKWFGFHHYDVHPDIITLGKGLNGGYAPLSAVGCKTPDLEVLLDRAGNFVHGHTFSHHAVAAAAALSVVQIMEEEDLVERAERTGASFAAKLERLLDHPHVGDIRGIGMMRAVEFVQEKKTKAPFPREAKVAERLFENLMQQGMISYKCIGFAGGLGDAVMLSPPYVVTDSEVDWIVDTLEKAIREVLS
ncbi:MAG: aspartate aminotransferase family protein [Thermodesulfobacteriota bacterium]